MTPQKSNDKEKKYRVFISYSHDNKELVQRIVGLLEKNGFKPMWDRDFKYSHRFTDQIKNFISYAHVFAPILTESSSTRGWVHQEIGYAMALNIPLLPICRGKLPGEMLREYQAVMLDDVPADKANLLSKRDIEVLTASFRDVEQMIGSFQESTTVLYECGKYTEDRTEMMVRYSEDVLRLDEKGHVRQKGALSSFHIPDKPVNDEAFLKRYGKCGASEKRCELLLKERQSLEKHARKKGCSIIIDPYLTYARYGRNARKIRLKTLMEFLESMSDDKVNVAIHEGMPKTHNITIVGDWFAAESVSAILGKGYQQTIFTRHAPTIISKIEAFDNEFCNLLLSQKSKRKSSRKAAMDEISSILKRIKSK